MFLHNNKERYTQQGLYIYALETVKKYIFNKRVLRITPRWICIKTTAIMTYGGSQDLRIPILTFNKYCVCVYYNFLSVEGFSRHAACPVHLAVGGFLSVTFYV